MNHAKVYGAILAVLLVLFCRVLADSRFRGQAPVKTRELTAISGLIPSADPGVENSARYIRHLGLSTPGSAFPDFPGQPDYLPSGMMWPPPLRFEGAALQGPVLALLQLRLTRPRDEIAPVCG